MPPSAGVYAPSPPIAAAAASWQNQASTGPTPPADASYAPSTTGSICKRHGFDSQLLLCKVHWL